MGKLVNNVSLRFIFQALQVLASGMDPPIERELGSLFLALQRGSDSSPGAQRENQPCVLCPKSLRMPLMVCTLMTTWGSFLRPRRKLKRNGKF
jgi:hypothetical protein